MKLNDFKLVSVCFFINPNLLTTENMGPTCLCFCVLYKCIHQCCIGKECDIYVRIYMPYKSIGFFYAGRVQNGTDAPNFNVFYAL